MIKAIKTFCAKHGIGASVLFGRYPYMFTPLQIAKLLELARETQKVNGSYVEAGCAYGASTVLFMKLFAELGLNRKGFALDTFSGFVEPHADHDIKKLARDASLRGYFRNNHVSWMLAALEYAGISNVEVVKGDATQFDYDRCNPIAFALLDVDLYQPSYDILPKLYVRLSSGGIIVVDDCAPSPKWEGALLAYNQFMEDIHVIPEIVCGKLGLVCRLHEKITEPKIPRSET